MSQISKIEILLNVYDVYLPVRNTDKISVTYLLYIMSVISETIGIPLFRYSSVT